MRLTIRSTEQIVEIEGVPCRLWNGQCENGERVVLYVHRVAVPVGPRGTDTHPFASELFEMEARPVRTAGVATGPFRHHRSEGWQQILLGAETPARPARFP